MPAVVIVGSPLLASVMGRSSSRVELREARKQLQTLAFRVLRGGSAFSSYSYSEDLRVRIVRAVQEEGISKSATARLFGVSLSSVKRYVRISDWGASLTPRKGGGRPPKVDQSMEKLLEEDVEQHPTATISQRRRFWERLTGKRLGDSTIRRVLKRLGFSQKNGHSGGAGTGRVAESCLEGDTNPRDRLLEEAGVRRGDGREHFALALARLVTTRRAGTRCAVPRNRGKNTTLLASM